LNKMQIKIKKENLKLLLIPVLTLLVILFASVFLIIRYTAANASLLAATVTRQLTTTNTKATTISITPKYFVNLPVPFTPEAPDGAMVKPWNNSCEEASLVMMDQYYSGNRSSTISKAIAKKSILAYIDIENKIFGYNANTNAAEMTKLANTYSKYFTAKTVTNPTLKQLKTELAAGRPIIALVYGFELHNQNIDFLTGGSYYHTFVIKGYDDKTNEFIVNDDGDIYHGLDLRYSYDTIMGALRDYSHKLAKTVYPATVLFTSAKKP